MEALRAAHRDLLDRIAAACRRAGRDVAAVELVAVSKGVPAPRLRAAVAAGITLFGENRVQEAAAKVDEVEGASWRLVGRLQRNKARRAVMLFAGIDALDSVDLARRLDALAAELRPGRPLPVYLEVNVDADSHKAGFVAEGLPEALAPLSDLRHLRLVGLMTVGRERPRAEEARPTFVRLREVSEQMRRGWPALGEGLSMGMSNDFEVAVEEGATSVRIGRALFGERPAG